MYYVNRDKIMEVLLCFIRDMLIWLWKLKKKKEEKNVNDNKGKIIGYGVLLFI